MNCSVLIPYKPDYGFRDFIWSKVRERYERLMPELQICLGIDESEPFCRARAINRAATLSNREIFIVTDTDLIFEPSLLENIAANIDSYPWLIPFSHGYRLNEGATRRLLEDNLPDNIWVDQSDILYNDDTPGAFLNVMKREAFERISGFDERFVGWGFEDTAFVKALDTLYGHYHRLEGAIYHLWHPEADKSFSQRNLDLLRPYQEAYDNIDKMRHLIHHRYLT